MPSKLPCVILGELVCWVACILPSWQLPPATPALEWLLGPPKRCCLHQVGCVWSSTWFPVFTLLISKMGIGCPLLLTVVIKRGEAQALSASFWEDGACTKLPRESQMPIFQELRTSSQCCKYHQTLKGEHGEWEQPTEKLRSYLGPRERPREVS